MSAPSPYQPDAHAAPLDVWSLLLYGFIGSVSQKIEPCFTVHYEGPNVPAFHISIIPNVSEANSVNESAR